MEVRRGYKQTEVGVIPEEWDAKPIGSLTSLMTNGFVGTVTNDYVDSEDGVLYVQGYNVEENGFNFHGIKRVSKAFHARNQKSCLQAGDLLTIQTGDIGITTVVPPSLAEANCHALVISRFDQLASDPGYYCQYFNSERGRIAFKAIETGSTMKHLNVGDMVKLFVPSPPFPEQRGIAQALSDADGLMESLERLLAKKRKLKQGAMQELLTGKKRLPGFSGEWEAKRLGEIVALRKDRIDPRRMDIQDFCVELEHIGQGTGRLVGSTATHDESSLKSVFQQDDVLFGKLRAYLRKYWFATCAGVCSTEIWVLVPKPSVLVPAFLFHLVTQDRFIEAASSSYGTHMPRSDWNVVKNYEVPRPAIEEQTAIAAILSDMDAEITALEEKLAKTRNLKQGMMQELLTGRIRLI